MFKNQIYRVHISHWNNDSRYFTVYQTFTLYDSSLGNERYTAGGIHIVKKKIHSQIGKCNKWVHVDSVAWDEFLWFLPFYPNHITRWHHTFIPKAYLGQTPIWSSRMANIYLALQDDFITSLDLTTVLLLALFWLWPFTPCKGVFWLWYNFTHQEYGKQQP